MWKLKYTTIAFFLSAASFVETKCEKVCGLFPRSFIALWLGRVRRKPREVLMRETFTLLVSHYTQKNLANVWTKYLENS